MSRHAPLRELVVRAFLEDVALNTRWLLGPVRKYLRRLVERINVVSCGGSSAVWCQSSPTCPS